jgi:hypothetical protein
MGIHTDTRRRAAKSAKKIRQFLAPPIETRRQTIRLILNSEIEWPRKNAKRAEEESFQSAPENPGARLCRPRPAAAGLEFSAR